MDLDHLVRGLLVELGKLTKSDAVAGRVIDAGDSQILPLSRVSIGFGTAGVGGRRSGGAGGSLDGSGAGGALIVEPRAFVVVGPDGVPHMLALKRGGTVAVRRGVEVHDRLAPQAETATPRAAAPVVAAPAVTAALDDRPPRRGGAR